MFKHLPIIALALAMGGFLWAEPLHVVGKSNPAATRKVSPLESLMSSPRKARPNTRTANDNRLLVMMVEFQPDTDANTTGTGQFLGEDAAADYPISLGCPPHDRNFFELQCEALRYYWLAGSMGYYDLDYEVWPRTGYYVLPHQMSYYYPKNAGSSLMVARFEEYFRDVFAAADADPDLTLGDFGHYMAIHAGSDYQHDVYGDTPCDLPSFFITVGDGKEVTVDDGATVIDNLSNVPETIVQDVSSTETDGRTYYTGYGVINSVMAHEFGHSLGLPDLYSTTNSRPAVGYFDIMDSGGSTVLSLGYDDDGDDFVETVYNIEGPVPAMPGAWSREFLWGDEMRAVGELRDIGSFDLSQPIELVAGGVQDTGLEDNQTYIVKIPLGDREYVLVENRQTDHDDDGATTLVSDDSNNPRVVLYPTGNDNNIADEYDYALPGWPGQDERYYGGGLMAWHVNDAVIYDDAPVTGGDYANNLEANTINVIHDRRAVSVIEADDIEDIGDFYSLYWQGTAYEPFFRYMPVLDENGSFAGWSVETFADSLTPNSKPPLRSRDGGDPCLFSLYDIDSEHYHRPFSAPPREVSFRCRLQVCDGNLSLAALPDTTAAAAFSAAPAFLANNALSELAFFSAGSLTTYSHLESGDAWDSPLGAQSLAYSTPYPVTVSDYLPDSPGNEYLLACDSLLAVVRSPGQVTTRAFGSAATGAPMYYVNESGQAVTVFTTQDSLYVNTAGTWEAWGLPAARVCSDGRYLYAFSQGRLWLVLSGSTLSELYSEKLPFAETPFEPVAYLDEAHDDYSGVYLQSPQGDIYRVAYGTGEVTQIFSLYPYTTEAPSQLALGNIRNDGWMYLVFGAGSRAFALTTSGQMASGFPVKLENKSVAGGGYPRILSLNDETTLLLPAAKGGYYALDAEGNYQPGLSMVWPSGGNDAWLWEEETGRLYFAGLLQESGACRPLLSWMEGIADDPIMWDGYRNDGCGGARGTVQPPAATGSKLAAIAYPNPCRSGEVRIGVTGTEKTINLKIYDIAGNLVYRKSGIDPTDPIRWPVRDVSSGVYFGVVESGGSRVTVKIGIEQ